MNNQYEYYSEAGTVWYPLKTNSNIIRELNSIFTEKSGFLISCMTHYKKLKAEHISNDRIGMINVYAHDDIYRKLYKEGIRFFVFDSLQKLRVFAAKSNISECKISIRLSFEDIFENYTSPIGASFKETQEMIDFLNNNNCLHIGLSIYFPEGYKNLCCQRKVFSSLIELFSQISYISVGGLTENLSEVKKITGKDIILEIGNDLVVKKNQSSNVIRKKTVNGIYTLVIDRGIYTGFFDSILKQRNFELCIKSDNESEIKLYQHAGVKKTKLLLFGGSGNVDDFIGEFYIEDSAVCKIEEGDLMNIKLSGAYFDELITLYGKDLMS